MRAYRVKNAEWKAVVEDRGLGLKERLFGDSASAAEEYFAGLENELRPTLRAQPYDQEKALAVLKALRPTYSRHEKAVEDSVRILSTRIEDREAEAAEAVTSGKRNALLLALGALVVVLVVGTLLLRSVLRSLAAISARMRQMAEGDADLSARLPVSSGDEAADLARSFNAFLDKIAALVRAVKRSALQLRATATEMAATSHEQEATVSSLGASATEIAAATKQISATGIELTSTMGEVGRVAKESSGSAVAGRASLGVMRGTMTTLAASSGQISQRLSAISEKARDITGVVTTITKVADQTNLLSVNAAIEAEKAGESGRGFLVVAREIRRLADQTASATLDIEKTVHQMQSAVSAGVMEMDKFSEQVRRSVAEVESVSARLDGIISQVQVLTDQFAHVSDGMKMQAEGAQQINVAMTSLSSNVQQTSRSLTEFTSAADEMKDAVEGLKQEMGKFRLED